MEKGERKVSAEHPIVAKKINKGLKLSKLSIKDGSFASVYNGLGASYATPFALALNATASQVGILHAVINLLPDLVRLKSPGLIGKFSRKKLVLVSASIRALLLLPIILTGYLFYIGFAHMVWVLIGLFGLVHALSAISHPAWFSWMGSLVPENERGAYFSRRNRITGFFGIVTMIAGAVLLDFSKNLGISNGDVLGYTLVGFGILFSLALLSRFFSLLFLSRIYEPHLIVRKKDRFSFSEFLKSAPKNPFE